MSAEESNAERVEWLEYAPFTRREFLEIRHKIESLESFCFGSVILPGFYKESYLSGEKAKYLQRSEGEFFGAIMEISDDIAERFFIGIRDEVNGDHYYSFSKKTGTETHWRYIKWGDSSDHQKTLKDYGPKDHLVRGLLLNLLNAGWAYTLTTLDPPYIQSHLAGARKYMDFILEREVQGKSKREELINKAIKSGLLEGKLPEEPMRFSNRIVQKVYEAALNIYDNVYLRVVDPELFTAKRHLEKLEKSNQSKEGELSERRERYKNMLQLKKKSLQAEEKEGKLDNQSFLLTLFAGKAELMIEKEAEISFGEAQERLTRFASEFTSDRFSDEELKQFAQTFLEDLEWHKNGNTEFKIPNGDTKKASEVPRREKVLG